jgi:hypothetical protein
MSIDAEKRMSQSCSPSGNEKLYHYPVGPWITQAAPGKAEGVQAEYGGLAGAGDKRGPTPGEGAGREDAYRHHGAHQRVNEMTRRPL